MLKKIIASTLVFSLLFGPVSSYIDQNPATVSAKSYKSGKRSYNSSTSNSSTFFKNSNNQQVYKQKTTTSVKKSTIKKSNKGSFLKGLFVGGLAGLLFGSLLGKLGILGSLLGLAVNILAIMALVTIVRKVISAIRNRRRNDHSWER